VTERFDWRKHLAVHPAADLFPPMSEPELHELGEDIKKNGQKSQIILWKDEKGRIYLVDGRNRLDAADLVGVENNFREGLPTLHWHFLDGDPYDLAISLNIHRRHLTAEQKRDLIAKVLKAKPEASNNSIAKQTKSDDKTVAKLRRKLESTSEIPKLDKTVGHDRSPGDSRAH